MDRAFRIHCSQIGKIMGRVGLTEKQEQRMLELMDRQVKGAKPLTGNMEAELTELVRAKAIPQLPQTAITYLMEWYSGDRDQLHNKYIDKGNYVESDLIEFMASQIGLGMAEKNDLTMQTDYMIGTADVLTPDMVIDVKAPWDRKTLNDRIEKPDEDYIWQLRGYMHLYEKDRAMVFYGLMDTPEEVNYGIEVSYANVPDHQRWVAYEVKRDKRIEIEIIERVKMCQDWISKYDLKVRSSLGRIHLI